MSFVYVIAAAVKGPCKIGFSSNPVRRRNSIQTGCHARIEVWSAWEPEHLTAREIEQRAHDHFADRRLAGEWFDISVQEAEQFIGRVEEKFDGFHWRLFHRGPEPLRVYTRTV